MKLDNVNKQILFELFKNGRENLTTINKNIFKTDTETMSHTGVKKRIGKLINSDILKIQGNINLKSLNYKSCLILLEVKNYDLVKEVIKAYRNCPRIFLLAQVSGQYNIIMGIVGKNSDTLLRFLNYCGPANKEGILHSEVLFISEIESPQFLPINLFCRESREHECGNTCQDCEAFLDGECDGCGNF
jgi:DNA-binding Lrp family transcriptional regulator